MGQRRVEVTLAFVTFVVIGLGGGAAGVLLPAQISHYHIDKSIIGLLFFAFSGGYLLAGVSTGWLMRRLGPRGELAFGTVLFCLMALGSGLQPPYAILVVLTVVYGFGTGIMDAGLNAYLASLPRRVVLLNLLHAFYGVGALIGPVLAVSLLERGLSWGSVYLVFAAAGVPLALGFALRYPRALPTDLPDAAPALAGEAAIPARTSVFGSALRHPAVLMSGLFLCVYVGVEITMGNWTFSLLVEERGQDAVLAGWVVSGYWLGFTAGRFVLSPLAERLGIGPVGLAWRCLAVVMGAGAVIWLAPGMMPAAVGLVALGAALGPLYPLTVAVFPRMAPGRLVPTAIGMMVGMSVIGGAFFPWVAGTLAESVGLGSLLPFTLLLVAGLLVNWWWLARRLANAPAPAPQT